MSRIARISLTLAAMVAASLLLAGCVPETSLPWTVGVYSYDLTNMIETAHSMEAAQTGYQWLLLEVDVRNEATRAYVLDPRVYEFAVRIGDWYYPARSSGDVTGGLGWGQSIRPKQTINGDLCFEVPASLSSLDGIVMTLHDVMRGFIDSIDIGSSPRR
jgi:hypothetical protein